MPCVNAFKAVQKLLAFVCSAKENDLTNGKGRINGSIKKIMEDYTGGETVSFKSLAQEHCILENCETLRMRLLRHLCYLRGSCEKWGVSEDWNQLSIVMIF